MGQNKLKNDTAQAKPAAGKTTEKGQADTSRSSNQGRKEASGGSKDTNNQGRPKGA